MSARPIKVVNDYNNFLAKNGLKYVTAEACAYGGRVLCELSPKGLELLQEFMSVMIVPNKSLSSEGSAGNIMLPASLMREYIVFLLFKTEQALTVHLFETGEFVAVLSEEENLPAKDYIESHKIIRSWWLTNAPRRGLGNIHTIFGVAF